MKNQINDKIAQLKERLGPSNVRTALIACCVLPCLIFIIFGHKPLIDKLKDASNRLQEVETELLEQHRAIAALKKIDMKDKVIQQNEIPLAIDELIEKGREFGLQFRSISPSPLRKTAQPCIWMLPVSFVIESGYKNLGQFLDYIETSSRNIAVAESLSINPKGENLSRLSVGLVINLYVERKNETK